MVFNQVNIVVLTFESPYLIAKLCLPRSCLPLWLDREDDIVRARLIALQLYGMHGQMLDSQDVGYTFPFAFSLKKL